jgi:hypothetical protein
MLMELIHGNELEEYSSQKFDGCRGKTNMEDLQVYNLVIKLRHVN